MTYPCEFAVDHYGIVEGADLQSYILIQAISLFFVVILLVVAVKNIVKNVCSREETHWIYISDMLFDFGIAVMVLVFVARNLPEKMASAQSATSILENLGGIPWSSSSLSLETKLKIFFQNVEELKTLIRRENYNNILCNVIVTVNLLRVIQFTSLHPRLAMLTGTVINALDDLWHTAVLTVLLMLLFAGLGNWRFGDRLEQFETVESTLLLEWEMLFGVLPTNWGDDKQLKQELQLWTVLYLMVVFLLILNFLLAIIVEAYMKVREGIDEHETENEFFSDVFHSLDSTCRRIFFGWPAPGRLGAVVESWRAKISVGYIDLLETGLFRSPDACVSFLQFYSAFDYMEPPVVGKYGKIANGESNGRSLKEMLVSSIVEVAQRREAQGRTTEAEILKLRLLRAAVHEQNESAKYSTDDALSFVEGKSEVQPTRTDVDQGPLLAPRRDPAEDILQDVDDILNSEHNR
jgi:hypothetical protein